MADRDHDYRSHAERDQYRRSGRDEQGDSGDDRGESRSFRDDRGFGFGGGRRMEHEGQRYEGGRNVRQGDPTYDPADISQGSRRSEWRDNQHYDDTGWTARGGGERHDRQRQYGMGREDFSRFEPQRGPSQGSGGQGQFGAGGYARGGYGDSGYGGDYGQRQGGQNSFGGEGRGRSYEGGQNRAQHGHADHDLEPDYVHWRNERLSAYDRDYSHWREEQSRKHDDEYKTWRGQRRGDFHKTFESWRSSRESSAALDQGLNPALQRQAEGEEDREFPPLPTGRSADDGDRTATRESGGSTRKAATSADPVLGKIADGDDGGLPGALAVGGGRGRTSSDGGRGKRPTSTGRSAAGSTTQASGENPVLDQQAGERDQTSLGGKRSDRNRRT